MIKVFINFKDNSVPDCVFYANKGYDFTARGRILYWSEAETGKNIYFNTNAILCFVEEYVEPTK
jgi:hypothetical protein